jgi:hypothetical protein
VGSDVAEPRSDATAPPIYWCASSWLDSAKLRSLGFELSSADDTDEDLRHDEKLLSNEVSTPSARHRVDCSASMQAWIDLHCARGTVREARSRVCVSGAGIASL